MGMLLNFIYQYIYLYLSLPVLLIVLIGKPRFVINLIYRIINLKEPITKVKIFGFIFGFNVLYVLYCLFRSMSLKNSIKNLQVNDLDTVRIIGVINYIDDKMREAHLFERNAFMFFTFNILILVINKLCLSHFKLWLTEKEYSSIQIPHPSPIKAQMTTGFKEVADDDKNDVNINKYDNEFKADNEYSQFSRRVNEFPVKERKSM
jgi:hypothetical protein